MNNTIAVAVWMAGAIASFTLMGVAGRELSAELDTWGILLFRSIVGLFVVLALLQIKGWHLAVSRRLPTQLFRNVVHYGGQFGWFYGISLLPMAQVFALEFTVPIWGLLLAAVFLKEQLTQARVIALVLGLTGVIVILRPGIIPLNIAVIAVLASALCYAITHIITKSIVTVDSPLTILFYMTLVQLPIGIVAAWPTLVMPSPALWPWVVVVGLSALSAHFCLAKALFNGDASVVLPVDFLRLPVIAVVAAILYGEGIDVWLFIGAALMVAGNLYSLRDDSLTDDSLTDDSLTDERRKGRAN
jgi:drug/metabolite transporter (DMT)-like permease